MIQILIVDDHAIVRRGLMQILTDEPDIGVSEAADAHEALKVIGTNAYDLVVLDLDLKSKSGLDLMKEIKREKPELPVLFLSVYPEEQFAVRTLKAGASGFMSKDAAPEELVNAIRKILRGGKYINDSVAERLLIDLNAPAQRAEGMQHEALSDREFQILRLFGEGKTVGEIAAELSISVPTVSTHRTRILEKMGMKTTAELVRYVIEHHLVP
ncbi:MAG: response regulator transcription factor [Blastocatellia bacterium]|nr:response regulator transcription factor [Blastocatellia bacterium]